MDLEKLRKTGEVTLPASCRPEPAANSGLQWPPLVRGRLMKRINRFVARIELDTGTAVDAHCPNTGRMTGCCEPGRRVYLSLSDNPRRKLKYTWELIDMPSSLVGINTMLPNRMVARAARSGIIPELSGYDTVSREVRVGDHSRIDLRLTGGRADTCFVEIKNCTLVEEGTAMFPDAVTSRGRKHLAELERLAGSGHRCVIFFFIQRMDAGIFAPADRIDPAYGEALRSAIKSGVEPIAYDARIDLEGIRIGRKIDCRL